MKYPDSVKPGIPKLPSKIPDGWQVVSMKDVFQEVARKVDFKDDETYNLVTVKRSRGGVEKRGEFLGSTISVKSQFYIKENDFLISKRQIVHGACGIVQKELEDSIVSNEYLVLKANANYDLDYLKHYTHSQYFQQSCFHSSIGVHIEKMIFKPKWWYSFKHIFPPFKEQVAIRCVLSNYDKSIALITSIINLLNMRNNGLVAKLYSHKNNNVKKVKLKEYCRVQGGFAFKSQLFSDTGTPIVRISDIQDNEIRFKSPVYYDDNGISEGFKLSKGDLLIAMSGATTGKIGEYTLNAPALLNQRVGKFVIKKKDFLKQNYLKYYVLSDFFQNLIKSSLEQGAQPNISSNYIENLTIPLVPIQEQEKVGMIMQKAFKETKLFKRKLSVLQEQKKGLMQKLLTGEIRVKTDNLT